MGERLHVSMKEDSSYLYATKLGIHQYNSVYLHNLRAKVAKREHFVYGITIYPCQGRNKNKLEK